MARARFIRPEFFTDDKIGELPRDVRLLFIGIWGHCDLNGIMEWRPKAVRIQLFPFDEDVTAERLDTWLEFLRVSERVEVYEVGEKTYLRVLHFREHQSFTQSEIMAWAKSDKRNPTPPGFIGEDPRKRGGYVKSGKEVLPEEHSSAPVGALASATPAPSPAPAPAPRRELESSADATARPAPPGLGGPGARAALEKKPGTAERLAEARRKADAAANGPRVGTGRFSRPRSPPAASAGQSSDPQPPKVPA